MINERLKKVRKTLNISAEELSYQIGTSLRAYYSYERNERNLSIESLKHLHDKFNVNLNYLVCGIEPMFNETAEQDEQLEKLVAKIVDKKMKEKGL